MIRALTVVVNIVVGSVVSQNVRGWHCFAIIGVFWLAQGLAFWDGMGTAEREIRSHGND